MNENRKHHHHVRWWSELWWKVWAGLLFLRFLLFSQLFGDGVPRMKETTAFLFIFFLFLQRKRAYSVRKSEPQSQQVTWSQVSPHHLMAQATPLSTSWWVSNLSCFILPGHSFCTFASPFAFQRSLLCSVRGGGAVAPPAPSLYARAWRGPRKMPNKSKKKKKSHEEA